MMEMRDQLAATAPIHYQQARRVYGAEMPTTIEGIEGFMTVWATLRYTYADAALTAREMPQAYEFRPDDIPLMVEMLRTIQLLTEDVGNMLVNNKELSYALANGEMELPESLIKARELITRIKEQGKWEQAKIEKPSFQK